MTTKRVLEIAQIVAVNYGVTVPEIMGPCRTADIAWARQVAYWITYKRAGLSMAKVARAFNRTDHTTISYAVGRIDAMRRGDPEFAGQMDGLADDACLAWSEMLGKRPDGNAIVECEVLAA